MKLFTRMCLTSLFITVAACGQATAVPKSECAKVVSHVKKVLGSNAPAQAEMMKQCEKATDEIRGCALAADKPMKLLKCDF